MAKRRHGFETSKSDDGTEIGVEAKVLAKGKEALFRSDFGTGVVIVFGVADGAKENGVGLFAGCKGVFG